MRTFDIAQHRRLVRIWKKTEAGLICNWILQAGHKEQSAPTPAAMNSGALDDDLFRLAA